ncbi:chordin-like isoform X2 [Xyrauchen texanus]|uniref:chordin-like isoform X2 n=1 Tax=Xyrauchen texanus TaxID=154827 RepID=UPI002241B57B|nr:chordin-like isoform X2 [Xyrauchen texanus]
MEALRLLCILGCASVASAQGSRLKTPALPIQPERELMLSKGLSGCSFGGRFYSLEDTWHPDLGEPFGIMHCVMCHCEPQRSHLGKVFGKVSCRNMKQDCPEPTCDDPVLLPGQCCKTCPKGDSERKEVESLFHFFQEKEDDLQKSYNDRSYISSEDTSNRDSGTDFVALLMDSKDSWLPRSNGVARARFTLTQTSLMFSITYQRMNRPSVITFLDSDGNTAFEFRVPWTETDIICGIWKKLPKSHIRQLEAEQLHVSMTTTDTRNEEIQGKIIKHRALFAETFSAILTSEEVHSGMGGIAMLTLSDTENNLHFILILQGLIPHTEKASEKVPVRVKLMYRQHLLREIPTNISADDSDFAEVLSDLNSRELFWLSRGQLHITVETEGQNPQQISGYISGKRSCDTLQSVMSSGSALVPGKTGGAGSAVFTLHPNGSLDYRVLVAGLTSAVVGVTIEMKPRRRSKRSVLYDVTSDYSATEERGGGRAAGSCSRVEARHIHMLLQNELFINIATADQPEGELRGQIRSLLYNGLDARRHELPVPLAGQFVSPPVRTGAGGHAWVSVDDQCHLHYEIVVNGLSKSEDDTVNAHLHGLAEIGEMVDSASNHKRLLTGFYGQQAQGVLKDISLELLRHLDEGTAYIQVSTKMNPRGEIRGRIHVPNSCEFGSRGEVVEEAEFDDLVFVRDLSELKKDPHTCFFEGEHHAHGSQWTPQYNTCFSCTCQKKTVICDPMICPALSCPHTIQPDDQCCPVCDEKKETKEIAPVEKVDESPEGCYFEGDQKMHAPGTTWHPFVPPFGYIKCAVCTCKGSTGEVHCEKVMCPALTCSRPIRRNPSDCCKECPAEDTPPLDDDETMQADGTRHCKFGKNFYQNSEHWHPSVPLVGEMKCITCWCDHGVTKCQRKQCPLLSCSDPIHMEGKCCPECIDTHNATSADCKTTTNKRNREDVQNKREREFERT